MYKKNYKKKGIKFASAKSEEPIRVFSRLMEVVARMLEADFSIEEIRCNVEMDGKDYTTDFVCRKDGKLVAYECVYRKHLCLPNKARLLDESRQYWESHGAKWCLVVERGDCDVCEE